MMMNPMGIPAVFWLTGGRVYVGMSAAAVRESWQAVGTISMINCAASRIDGRRHQRCGGRRVHHRQAALQGIKTNTPRLPLLERLISTMTHCSGSVLCRHTPGNQTPQWVIYAGTRTYIDWSCLGSPQLLPLGLPVTVGISTVGR
jgi:hypothetical protein